MMMPERKAAIAIAVAGAIIASIAAYLTHYFLRHLADDGIHRFTVAFVAIQVVICFAIIAFHVMKGRSSSAAFPVRIWYVWATAAYSLVAITTAVRFHVLISLNLSSRNTLFTCVLVETAAWIVALIILYVVNTAQLGSHRESEVVRKRIEELTLFCHRLASMAGGSDTLPEASIRELATRIRFSEAIRRDQTLLDEVSKRLSQLESFLRSCEMGTCQGDVSEIVSDITRLVSERR